MMKYWEYEVLTMTCDCDDLFRCDGVVWQERFDASRYYYNREDGSHLAAMQHPDQSRQHMHNFPHGGYSAVAASPYGGWGGECSAIVRWLSVAWTTRETDTPDFSCAMFQVRNDRRCLQARCRGNRRQDRCPWPQERGRADTLRDRYRSGR